MTILGRGNFGVVKLEVDTLTGRRQAVKYVKASEFPDLIHHFEPQAMARAEHANVVKVFHAEVVSGELIIRMEYLAGGSVQDRFCGHPAPVKDAIEIVEEACRGVHHLHTQGLLHRDIKPANLLFDESGRVKVSDFGLAGRADDPAALPANGYLPLLPPECWVGQKYIDDQAGDIYALGVTAYRLLNGDDMLFEAYPLEGDLGSSVVAGQFPDRKRWQPYVHPPLRRAVAAALHVNPDKRFQTAADFRLALTRAQPCVSWQVRSPIGWTGFGIDNFLWDAQILESAGSHTFILRRGRSPEKLREVRADRFKESSLKKVEVHARSILQRVAQRGA